jgi:hypothetical protein
MGYPRKNLFRQFVSGKASDEKKAEHDHSPGNEKEKGQPLTELFGGRDGSEVSGGQSPTVFRDKRFCRPVSSVPVFQGGQKGKERCQD